MKHVIRLRMPHLFLLFISLCFLSGLLGPGTVNADLTINSSIGLTNLLFSTTENATISWLEDPTAPNSANTQGSLSGSQVLLNGAESDPYDPDIIEGSWGDTSNSAALSDSSGNVTASAQTTPESAVAIHNIALTSLAVAQVLTNQATLSGQFTVTNYTTLTVLANYAFIQDLTSISGGLAFSDLLAELWIDNYDTTARLAYDAKSVVNEIFGASTFSDSGSGFLTLVLDLSPGIVYDFQASASTTASTVPEPVSMLLFGTGAIVCGRYIRKKMTRVC